MDFELDPGQKTILEMVKWLAKDKIRPIGLEYDKKGTPIPPDHPFFKEMKSMGVTLRMGAEGGGKKGKGKFSDFAKKEEKEGEDDKPSVFARTGVLAAEILAWGDIGTTMSLPGPGLATPAVRTMGSPEIQEMFFSSFDVEEPRWGAFALTEPGAGSDVARIRATARKEGDYYIINGEKTFITNGARAMWNVVFATVDPSLGRDGHRAFLVKKGTEGFRVGRIEDKMGIHASETAGLVFEDCKVHKDFLLGGEEYYSKKAGFKGAMETFNASRPMVAAMSIGVARAAYEYTRDYLKETYMLSRPTALYRKLKEILDTMKRKLDVAMLLCIKASWMIDIKKPNAKEAAMAKAYAPPVSLWTASKCVELLGEEGTLEYHQLVEKCYRDLKVFDIFEGTGQVQRIIVSRKLFAEQGKPATLTPSERQIS